ncbi:MAG: aldo/keto reductase [Ruminococcus sp.]|nr:aldo/keto reductase [Ruminococcus sp.]
MEYRKIGETKVSLLGFGCMRFPQGADGEIDLAQTDAMLTKAYEAGVNYFDTAYVYHNQKSEEIAASFLKKFPRDTYYFADKLPCWDASSVEKAKELLQTSLDRLGTDYIDFYLLHALNKDSWKNMKERGIVEWLEGVKASGVIRNYGFSFHDDYDTFIDIVNYRKWDFCQIQINYMDVDEQAGMKGYEECVKLGIPVVVMEPVKGGSLAMFPDDILAPLKAVNPDDSAARWALRWCGTLPGVSVILSGMSSMAQVDDNLETFKEFKPLSDTETKALDEHMANTRSRKFNNCTWCNYCMPCPAGVNIPRIFRLLNNFAMYANKGDVKWNYEHEIPDSQKPDKCVNCGKCVSHCPQHIAIPEDLKTAGANIKDIIASL